MHNEMCRIGTASAAETDTVPMRKKNTDHYDDSAEYLPGRTDEQKL